MLYPIKVEIPKAIDRDFKLLAKERFPIETFGIFLGRSAGTIIELEELWIPEDLKEFTSQYHVHLQPNWWKDAHKHAREQDLYIVGDIHSHCFKHKELKGSIKPQPVPSEMDLDCGQLHITGICMITEDKNKKRRARTRFWGPQFEVIEKYV